MIMVKRLMMFFLGTRLLLCDIALDRCSFLMGRETEISIMESIGFLYEQLATFCTCWRYRDDAYSSVGDLGGVMRFATLESCHCYACGDDRAV